MNGNNPKLALDSTLHDIIDCRRKTNINFIIISSLNRANYNTEISYESFKETGTLEFSADVIWGLQLETQGTRTHQSIKSAKNENPRFIQLLCLKNLFGTNFDVGFKYYLAVDLFLPNDEYGNFTTCQTNDNGQLVTGIKKMLKQNMFKTKLKKIKEFVVPIDKLSSVIFDTDKVGIEGIVENRHLDILTPFSLKLFKDNNGNDIFFAPLDKLIISAAVSEQLSGNYVISFSRIFHVIGGGDKLKFAPIVQSSFIDRISKLRRTEISMGLTDLLTNFKNYAETLGINPNHNGKIKKLK